jgi:hypothetical protein
MITEYDANVVCGEPLVSSTPPGFDPAPIACTATVGFMVVYTVDGRLSVAGYCYQHIGGALSRLLDHPSIETFTVSAVS